jgi:DNA-binding MarR family transcriptional regulator
MVQHIVMRYNKSMAAEITDAEYGALAELRFRIRQFLREGDAAARKAGLEPQQYLLLLAIRGLPRGSEATIRVLAERLALKHHSAVELIDRLEGHGLVRRQRSDGDRREVRVTLRPRGARLLESVARQRIGELRAGGAALAKAIHTLVQQESKLRPGAEGRQSGKRPKPQSSRKRAQSQR